MPGTFNWKWISSTYTYDSLKILQHGNSQSEEYQVAPMNLKVGVFNNADFQVVLAPWQWQRTESNSNLGRVGHQSGFGDTTLRIIRGEPHRQ